MPTIAPHDMIDAMCGVYYLWDGAEVIYVGASRHIERRVSAHRSRFDFAGYFVDECPPNELNRREAAAIIKYQPIFNGCGNLQP